MEQSNAQQALNAVDKDWSKWSALGKQVLTRTVFLIPTNVFIFSMIKQAKKRTPEPPRPSKEDPKYKTRVNNANEDVMIKAKAVSDELETVIAAKSEIHRVKDEIKRSTGGSWKWYKNKPLGDDKAIMYFVKKIKFDGKTWKAVGHIHVSYGANS